MVEADEYAEAEKSFVEEPAILDKYKAAAGITDGKHTAPISNRHMSRSSFYSEFVL